MTEPIVIKQQGWRWILTLGITFILLGTIGLGMSFILTMASVFIFGLFVLSGGIFQMLQLFYTKEWRPAVGHGVIALLYLIAGISMMTKSLIASSLITLVLACIFIAIGVSRVIIALSMRQSRGFSFLMLAGIASTALGAFILLHFPASGFWFIGLYIAIEMLLHGFTLVLVALSLRAAN